MPDQVYRQRLRDYTGATSSTAEHLTGRAFEVFMPVLESAAHLAHINGTAHGQKPRKIQDWYYWRNRYRDAGMATHAQLYRIEKLYDQLCTILWPDQGDTATDSTPPYLLEIAGQAAGRFVEKLSDLTKSEGRWLIEALKDRIRYAIIEEPATA